MKLRFLRYWFYLPFFLAVLLSLFVVAIFFPDGVFDAFTVREVGIPVVFLLGITGLFGGAIHVLIISCQSAVDISAPERRRRECVARTVNISDSQDRTTRVSYGMKVNHHQAEMTQFDH